MSFPEFGSISMVDVIILIILVCGFISGFVKGVVKQAFSLGGLVAGLILGNLLCRPVASLLMNILKMSDKSATVIAFILILIIVPFIFTWIGGALSKLVKIVRLGFLDRLLGGVFGLISFIVFTGLVIKLLDYTKISDSINDNDSHNKSVLYEPVRDMTDACLHWTWDKVLTYSKYNISEEKEQE